MADTVPRWLFEWFVGNDHGLSSETIAWILSGNLAVARRVDASLGIPGDGYDVGRCVRLLDLAASHGEDWRDRLPEVAAVCPAWAPLVREWAAIEAAFEADQDAYPVAEAEARRRWPRSWMTRPGWRPDACSRLLGRLRGRA